MAPSSPAADAWTGRLVGGRWRIVSLLDDSGGMASVYLARDERLDRQAVVKMPKASHLNEEFAERFAREARWHAKVENLHVVHILDRGEEAGTPFLVLQYLPGGNLKAWCERNPSILADPRLHYESWLLPIAQALDAVAAQGIVHRDVKPSNILFDAGGQAYLSDFGIVKAGNDATMTGTGMFIGTLQFMSPEQCDSEAKTSLDGRSDQYGLAVTLYQVLTGWKYPVDDTTVGPIFKAKLGLAPLTAPRDRDPRIPQGVSDAVMRALATDRERRFASSVEFAQAVLEGFGSLAERRSPDRDYVLVVPANPGFADRPTERPSPSAVDSVTQRARDGGNSSTSGPSASADNPSGGPSAGSPARLLGGGAVLAGLFVAAFLLGRNGGHWQNAGSSVTAAGSVAERQPVAAIPPQPVPRPAAPIAEPVRSPPLVVPDKVRPRVLVIRDFDVVENSLGMKLVRIPAGEFEMGSYVHEGFDSEKPIHRVKVTRPFLLGQTEVTQGQFEKVMGETPWRGQKYVNEGPAVAADYVSWEAAVEFCQRLTDSERRADRLVGKGVYRLPTEAEWEYACRAGTKTKWSFGDDEGRLGEYAWFWGNNKWLGAQQVGQKKPNPWNLYDVYGNVSEWCNDWSGNYPSGVAIDPTGPTTGSFRVTRGGGFQGAADYCRSASRHGMGQSGILFDMGFRVVCDLE